jgi:hypothetical protein
MGEPTGRCSQPTTGLQRRPREGIGLEMGLAFAARTLSSHATKRGHESNDPSWRKVNISHIRKIANLSRIFAQGEGI